MKTCTKCKEDKSEEEFNFKNKAKGLLQPVCKTCGREATRKHYDDNKQYYIDKAAKRSKKVRGDFHEYKATLCCLVCNENESICLDFHHLDPSEKDMSISSAMLYYGTEKFQKEIDKCVVLCSNCHRKLHAGLIELTSDSLNE